jgi:hypothetical protein
MMRNIGSEAGSSLQADHCDVETPHPYSSSHQYEPQSYSWDERPQSITRESNEQTQLVPHGMPISDHILSEVLSPASICSSRSQAPAPTASRTKSWIQISSPLASAPVSKLGDAQLQILPRVFMPFPRHLNATDLSYLHSRDALTLPSESLQIEILKAYVEYVNGSMPLLDLEEFLSSVKYGCEGLDGQKGRGIERENAGEKHISFLLFQAVMFAGVGYVSLKQLREAGYKSRESAKRAFFSRVRVCLPTVPKCLQNPAHVEILVAV